MLTYCPQKSIFKIKNYFFFLLNVWQSWEKLFCWALLFSPLDLATTKEGENNHFFKQKCITRDFTYWIKKIALTYLDI